VCSRASASAAHLLCFLALFLAFLGATAEPAKASATGNFPLITLLCKYSDIDDEPRDLFHVQRLYGNEKGGINHYWKQASYNRASLDGTQVAGWYTLPQPRAAYFDPFSGEADVNRLVRDCSALADAEIDFSQFFGINVLTNGPWSGGGIGGVGGELFRSLDGKSEFAYTLVGYPDWDNQGLLVHELGHGFGLLHSNNSDEDEDFYDNPWSVMSDVNNQAILHPEFGLLAKHFNAYEKDVLGWLDRNEVLEIDLSSLASGGSQRVSLTSLGRSATSSGSFRMLKLVRGAGSEDFFFTLEAREQSGDYEAALAGSGVIIHEVDLRTRRSAWVVDESDPAADRANTESVIWKPGETYRGEGFTVQILSRSSTGFDVSVRASTGAVAGNSVPAIQPVAARQNAAVGGLFQLYLLASDLDGFNPDLLSPDLPLGSTLTDNGNGVWIFDWTPASTQLGSHSVTFIARDAIDASLTTRLSVDIEVARLADLEDETAIPQVSNAPGEPEPVRGNLPWVTLLCKFQDEAEEPATTAFVQDMFGDGIGQINHWWKEVSYDRVNINGSLVLGWYTLPSPRSSYILGDNSVDDVNEERMTRECMHAADADVDFSRFYGVNTFFNAGFNSFSVGYGEPRSVALDNAGILATTTISSPAWTRHTSVIHEMMLATGLPRANNSDRDSTPFDNPWTNMSDGQGHASADLRYQFLAKHLNAFEKYSLGWLPSHEVTELQIDTAVPGGLFVQLAPMSEPELRASARRAVILRDTRYGRDVFYTVEARDNGGRGFYDDELPGTAVIVHQVDLQRDEPAWSLFDIDAGGLQPATYASTENDMWTVGETIELPGALISVTGRTRDGFNLHIQTGLDNEIGNTTSGSGVVSRVLSQQTPDSAVNQDTQLSGWLPWATLMCNFADSEESIYDTDFADEMFGSEPGQLGDYWSRVSSNRITIAGSEAFGWYTLSGDRRDYISETEISQVMLDECMALADDDVDFSLFYGINMFFGDEFNAVASGFGGRQLLSMDNAGVKPFTALGDPTWRWQAAVAHEMARAMGLPLTDNADEDDNPYDNPWTLMSDSRAYSVIDPVFNFRAKYINAHDMERLQWLDRGDVLELDPVTLNNNVSLQIDLSSLSTQANANPRLLKIPDLDDSGLHYYVEARERSGPYDGNLPASGVLIHEVRQVDGVIQTARLFFDVANGEAADYADSDDDVWVPGESAGLGAVTLDVSGVTADGFQLTLSSDRNVEAFPLVAAELIGDTANIEDLAASVNNAPANTSPGSDTETGVLVASNGNTSVSSPGSNSGSSGSSSGGGGGSFAVLNLLVLFLIMSFRLLPVRRYL